MYVPETRPLLQGARLTAYELAEAGVRHTLVTDNAAVRSCGRARSPGSWSAPTGSPRTATPRTRSAPTTSPCGPPPRCPVLVVAPTSTIDPATPSGAAIPIEQRSGTEVTGFGDVVTAPTATPARNDAFDVTPAELVTAIVTEHGVLAGAYDLREERPDG